MYLPVVLCSIAHLCLGPPIVKGVTPATQTTPESFNEDIVIKWMVSACLMNTVKIIVMVGWC